MTITHNHTITYTHEEGWSIELPEAPLDYFHELPTDGVVVDGNEVRFIVHDDTLGYESFDDLYGDTEYIVFKDFSHKRNATAEMMNETIQNLRDEGYNVYPVGKYEHGMVDYSIHGETTYPDMRWDYGIAGVIGVKGLDEPMHNAALYLKAYTDWCNGSVYAVVTVHRDRPGEYEACGGFIGDSAMDAVLTGGF
jgi:hypothetical protein